MFALTSNLFGQFLLLLLNCNSGTCTMSKSLNSGCVFGSDRLFLAVELVSVLSWCSTTRFAHILYELK